MNVLFYNPQTSEPIAVASYSCPEDIPVKNTFVEITPEDMDYHLEIVKNKKTRKVTYKRGEKIYRPEQIRLQKIEFRKRLTLEEKLWWDHFEDDKTLAPDKKKMINTIMKDFDLSPVVDLQDPDFRRAIEYLAGIGKIQKHRVEELLRIE